MKRGEVQKAILKAARNRPVTATYLRDKYGRSVYLAINALEAQGLVTTEWRTGTYPPTKVVTITEEGRVQ